MSDFFRMPIQVFPGGLGKGQNAEGIFRAASQRAFLAAADEIGFERRALSIEQRARSL